MGEALFQSILGHGLIVIVSCILIALLSWCFALVSEIEEWPKSMDFFKATGAGATIVAVFTLCFLGLLGIWYFCNGLYCNSICA